MDREQFLQLPAEDVAALVRAQRPAASYGMPMNGTRRWYALQPESEAVAGEDRLKSYMTALMMRQADVHRMIYAHGIQTILCPLMSGRLTSKRGETYTQIVMQVLALPATDATMLAFYDAMDIRVRFYGEYAGVLAQMGHADIAERYEQVMEATAGHRSHLLLYGVWAEDTVEVARVRSVEFFKREGRAPTRAELIREYYGVDLDALDMYVGFAKPKAYDMPLLLDRRTALYFTAAPSPMLTERALRTMLYDMCYTRRTPEVDMLSVDAATLEAMRAYYAVNLDEVTGAGVMDALIGCWVPAWGHVEPARCHDAEPQGAHDVA